MKTREKAKYIQRFEQLIRVMKSLTEHQATEDFYMRDWCRFYIDGEENLITDTLKGYAASQTMLPKGCTLNEAVYHCGTSKCAAGWAACDSWFTKRGFKLVVDELNVVLIGYKDAENWQALLDFFGYNVRYKNKIETGNVTDEAYRVFLYPKSVAQVITAAEREIEMIKLGT